MIVCRLQDLAHQIPITPTIQTGLDFLASLQAENLDDGPSEIARGRIQVLVRTYVGPKDGNLTFEGHHNCVEFQYVVSGKMQLGCVHRDRVTVARAYDEGKDSWMGKAPAANTSLVWVDEGEVIVFWPEDAHALGATPDGPAKKVTLKIDLDATIAGA